MTKTNDTTPAAAELQTKIYRRLSNRERLALAVDMSMSVRKLALTRLRKQHPDWSERDLTREVLRYAYGSSPLPPPLR